jgi:hypothetical protein
VAAYRGHVHGGTIVVDGPMRLPEGATVVIRPEKKVVRDPTGIAGLWVDERSPQEIVSDIRGARRSKK